MQTTQPGTDQFDLSLTVGQMVTEHPRWARVFEKWGIDYCCGGKKPLPDLCAKKGVELSAVLHDLEGGNADDAEAPDWSKLSLSKLVDNIITTHHDYLREELPRLNFLIDRVSHVHGEAHPELYEVKAIFDGFRPELEVHMMKEEMILFPLIKELEAASGLPSFHCGSVANPIRMMEAEHDDAGDALTRMRELTDGFTPPEGACNTYRVMLNALAELEVDMHQHVHKENNILFPRAIELEASFGA